MTKRKAISTKTRFEVFKRDRFTCQYCGAKAPDAVLHVDHIKPVAAGGGNDILNLVTACQACNGGKGARRLDDRSEVERQRAQLEELEQRREQLEMMLKWRDQAEAERIDVVDEISERIGERGGGFVPNENGRLDIRRWLKRYNADEILKALDEAFDTHMEFRGEKPVQRSWEAAFKAIPMFATRQRNAKGKPWLQRLAYTQGILRRRLDDPHLRCMAALEGHLMESGVPVNPLLDIFDSAAKQADSWEDFQELVAIGEKQHWGGPGGED